MQHGGFQHRAPMRLTLALSDAFLAGLWLTGFGMYFQRMGLSPASVREYYLGSPDGFSNPRSYAIRCVTRAPRSWPTAGNLSKPKWRITSTWSSAIARFE